MACESLDLGESVRVEVRLWAKCSAGRASGPGNLRGAGCPSHLKELSLHFQKQTPAGVSASAGAEGPANGEGAREWGAMTSGLSELF